MQTWCHNFFEFWCDVGIRVQKLQLHAGLIVAMLAPVDKKGRYLAQQDDYGLVV